MAKSIALTVSVLCILALAGFAHCHEITFHVEGKVYCDTCRAQFETKISQNIPGASVRLQCRKRDCGTVTYSVDGVTNQHGQYNLPVRGDHEEEICEVSLVKSPWPSCSDPMVDSEPARVICTENSGIISKVRYANPLGFMKTHALPNCKQVLDELGFFPLMTSN